MPISLQSAYIRADRITGIMLLVVLLTIGTSVFISSALAKDRSQKREQSILSQCFSPAIVNKFYSSPEVIERFYRQWMTVFFIDIRGFTKAVEKDAKDVEGLALKLRKVMDTARRQIVVSHEGIIDKFMGDAVMGWVGGHFSVHWKLMESIRKKLFIEELDFIIKTLKVLNISDAMVTYEPFFANQVSDAFLATFEKGVIAMEAEKIEAAMAFFHKANQLRAGGDAAAQIWLKTCTSIFQERQGVRKQ